ncbi:hypothetical protein CAEBREN_32017 [Caenorhabditis brenneri]|uniref:Uncharacterized protein n=1 Tax=Caenorhabditis brenneri TaxID=135651 RepID=G0MU44_CAEBE|nr:hypothetical protein CAEBREN_32017 [Caenorhabditis brenneri]
MTSFFSKTESQSEETSQKQCRKVVQVKNCSVIS